MSNEPSGLFGSGPGGEPTPPIHPATPSTTLTGDGTQPVNPVGPTGPGGGTATPAPPTIPTNLTPPIFEGATIKYRLRSIIREATAILKDLG